MLTTRFGRSSNRLPKPLVAKPTLSQDSMGVTIITGELTLSCSLLVLRGTFFVDVQCINILSPSHVAGYASSTKIVLSRAAKRKKLKYQADAEALNATFVPFIVTAQGDIGKEAQQLLRALTGDGKFNQPDPKLLLSLTIQRSVARAQMWAAQRCHSVRFRLGLM